MDKHEVDLVKWERLERFGTIAAFLLAAISLHSLDASDAVVGGAIGAASALVLPGGAASRPRAVALAGAGAIVGALMGGWAPGLA